ncbi:putative porin [Seonamhaeicola sp.]|uniref:putative porin n=1 Tax=Seonamhaeicola sp. TaxID=1912245 RepID=UPI00260EEC1C|nr:putative porin [Seonamhaeicola sp.]
MPVSKINLFLLTFGLILNISAQNTILEHIKFEGDFRFRVEQDWDSRKSDGTYRNDRTRMRYRARVGATYNYKEWATVGLRLRTGNPIKQQDPQITLGDVSKEFGTLPVGFEKVYFKAKHKNIEGWIGKNTFPFEKNNEQFWSDNVFPEGIFLKNTFPVNSGILDAVSLGAGHFIAVASGESLGKDAYFQGFQTNFRLFDNRLSIFPSMYVFRNIPDIPDGAATFVLDYNIFHVSGKLNLCNKPNINWDWDYYQNLEDYENNPNIPQNLKDETSGFVSGVSYGQLKAKGDLFFKLTYNYLQRYAAVDFFTQNDWARWDYSAFDSPDGRLTNYKGIEFVAAYSLNKRMNLVMKYYLVEQLVPYGIALENGSRIRFDIDVKF